MYDQIREDSLYSILYSVVTAMAAMASFYLLFRRGNAFAPDRLVSSNPTLTFSVVPSKLI